MKNLKNLFMSFAYAFRGIYYALKYERNMRIHFTCMVYMYSFLLIYDFFKVSATQFAVIFLGKLSIDLLSTLIKLLRKKGYSRRRSAYSGNIRRACRHCNTRSARGIQGNV